MKTKTIKNTLIACLILALSTTFFGCGEAKLQGPLNGKWSYIYDTEAVGLEIKDNGKAVLDGKKYTVSYTDEVISLTDKDGVTQSLRYFTDGDKIYLFKQSYYKLDPATAGEGLVGVWTDIENGNSSFEFTDNGTFKEDSYIPGYYYLNEDNGSILLVYNDHYEDTLIYYTIKDDVLFVEYPWPMVKTGK